MAILVYVGYTIYIVYKNAYMYRASTIYTFFVRKTLHNIQPYDRVDHLTHVRGGHTIGVLPAWPMWL